MCLRVRVRVCPCVYVCVYMYVCVAVGTVRTFGHRRSNLHALWPLPQVFTKSQRTSHGCRIASTASASKWVAKPSLSHVSSHHAHVTRFPNHCGRERGAWRKL